MGKCSAIRFETAEKINKDSNLVDEQFRNYQMNSIRDFINGENDVTHDTAHGIWLEMQKEGYTPFSLAKELGVSLLEIRTVIWSTQ